MRPACRLLRCGLRRGGSRRRRGNGWQLNKGESLHSLRRAQYTSKDFAALCAKLEVTQSMGAVGTSADNSLAESFNAALKREVLQDAAAWPDERTCRREVFRWVARYNTRRRHSWCGQQYPDAFEAANTTTLAPAA